MSREMHDWAGRACGVAGRGRFRMRLRLAASSRVYGVYSEAMSTRGRRSGYGGTWRTLPDLAGCVHGCGPSTVDDDSAASFVRPFRLPPWTLSLGAGLPGPAGQPCQPCQQCQPCQPTVSGMSQAPGYAGDARQPSSPNHQCRVDVEVVHQLSGVIPYLVRQTVISHFHFQLPLISLHHTNHNEIAHHVPPCSPPPPFRRSRRLRRRRPHRRQLPERGRR